MHRLWATVADFSVVAGGRVRRVDPLSVWRRLKAAGISLNDELKLVQEFGDDDAIERVVDAARAAFGLLPKSAGGVTDAEALDALGAFMDFATTIQSRFKADADLAATYGVDVLGSISPICRFGLVLNADRAELRIAARWKFAMDIQQSPPDDLWRALAETDAEAEELSVAHENARDVAAILSRCRAEVCS